MLPAEAILWAVAGTEATLLPGALLAVGSSTADVDEVLAGAVGELFHPVRVPAAIGTWIHAASGQA